MRPGYLARWVEFTVLHLPEGKSPIHHIRERYTEQVKETQKNVEIDHQKYMDGVNRNFNEQAIQLRIQIEEINLGRKLTEQEK